MDEVNVNNGTENEEVEALIPDGWDGEGDFFDDASWSDPATAEEDGEAPKDSTPTEDPTTVDGTEDPFAAEDAPTTEQPEAKETNSHKLKFTAKVDHNDLDVELDESDLPDIYQKAQVVDRVQSQMGKMKGTVDRASKLAKGMGFDNADAMLIAAAKNHLQNEIDRLVNDDEHPVHPDVARDIMERRLGYTLESLEQALDGAAPQTDETPTAQEAARKTPAGRDISSEVQELLTAHPELVGKELPDEVAQAAAQSGEKLLTVYQRYAKGNQAEQMKSLVKENQILKQNAETAKRAPVSGVTGHGIEGNTPDDPFLAGFESGAW